MLEIKHSKEKFQSLKINWYRLGRTNCSISARRTLPISTRHWMLKSAWLKESVHSQTTLMF